jgi:hypothetical protein
MFISRKAMVWMGAVGITLACTCGPLTQVQQAVEEAQALATQVEAVAPTLQAAATEFEDMQPTLDALATQSAEAEAAGGDSGGGAAGTDYCTLVTDAEVQTATSGTVSQTQHQPSTDGGFCSWIMADSSAVIITVIVGTDTATTDLIWQSGYKATLGSPDQSEAVTGAWDDGFWNSSISGVYFKKGVYVVFVQHSGGTSSQDGLVSLATLFAERLP